MGGTRSGKMHDLGLRTVISHQTAGQETPLASNTENTAKDGQLTEAARPSSRLRLAGRINPSCPSSAAGGT